MKAESNEQLLPCPAREYAEKNYAKYAEYFLPNTDLSGLIRAMIRAYDAGRVASGGSDSCDTPNTRTASWTAIEDGLPKESGMYLTNAKTGAGVELVDTTRFTTDIGWNVNQGLIRAWMPIPPYQPKTAKENDDER